MNFARVVAGMVFAASQKVQTVSRRRCGVHALLSLQTSPGRQGQTAELCICRMTDQFLPKLSALDRFHQPEREHTFRICRRQIINTAPGQQILLPDHLSGMRRQTIQHRRFVQRFQGGMQVGIESKIPGGQEGIITDFRADLKRDAAYRPRRRQTFNPYPARKKQFEQSIQKKQTRQQQEQQKCRTAGQQQSEKIQQDIRHQQDTSRCSEKTSSQTIQPAYSLKGR